MNQMASNHCRKKILLTLALVILFSCSRAGNKEVEKEPEKTPDPVTEQQVVVEETVIEEAEASAGDSAPEETEGESKPALARPSPAMVWEANVPVELRRPAIGEAPRFPADMVIGELGQGSAANDVYQVAQRTMNSLLSSERRQDTLSVLGNSYSEQITGILEEVEPRLYRIGGGREETDGSVSFLIRFIGRDKRSAGEVYFRLIEDRWTVEDLILEISEEGKTSRFDFPSYERFL